jgi:GNAT superfamily N-acetyltransferase
MRIRDIDPNSTAEVDLVAQRMLQTLIEVEGSDRGSCLYTMEWLVARVRWHLDGDSCRGRVLLAELPQKQIAGHAIVRLEPTDSGQFGLVSTTYIDPCFRRTGLASALLAYSERWFSEEGMPSCGTWTSSTNAPLIALYERHGYSITDSGANDLTGTPMVRLSKQLTRKVA